MQYQLNNIPIKCLSATTNDKALLKTIGLLPNYGINNMLDLCGLTPETLSKKSGLGKSKIGDIMRLVELIKDETIVNAAVAYYEKCIKTQVLPSAGDAEESDGDVIKRFLKEYVNLFYTLESHNLLKKKASRHKLVELAYIHNFTRETIANREGIEVERVRQSLSSQTDNHKSFIWQLRNMVDSGCLDGDISLIQLSERFRILLQDIKSLCQSCPSLDNLKKRLRLGNSDEDRAALKFILHYAGAKVFGGDVGVDTRINDQFVVCIDVNNLKKQWGAIFKLLDDKIVPYAKDALVYDIKLSKAAPEVQNTVINIIENSPQFIKTEDGRVMKYQLHWKDLCSAQSRVERIVFEMGKPCSRQAIITEYNKRALLNELPLFNETTGIKSKRDSGFNRGKKLQNICEYQAGGVWIWKDLADSTKTLTIATVVEKYMIENEQGSFEEVFNHVCQYFDNPNARTVRTTLNRLCYSTQRGHYIYKKSNIATDCDSAICVTTKEDITPYLIKLMKKGESYSYRDLWDKLLVNGSKVHLSKIRQCCITHPQIFTISKGANKKESDKVSINPDWNGEFELNAPKGKPKKAYKILMRECAINLLRVAENHTMLQRDVIAQIKKHLPEDIKINNTYKIFNDKIFIRQNIGKSAFLSLNLDEWKAEYQQNKQNSTIQSADNNSKKTEGDVEVDLMNFDFNRDLDKLRDKLKSFLQHELSLLSKDNMAIANFDDAWDKLINLVDIKKQQANNPYERLFALLYLYLFGKTSIYDRYFLYNEMRFSIEPFLKRCFKKMGIPFPINCGFNSAISICRSYRYLPPRDIECRINKSIGLCISARNWIGHNEEITPDDAIMVGLFKSALILLLHISKQI